MADRYPGYSFLKALLDLAYCWAHVRRDFLEERSKEKDRACADLWVARIGGLYSLNKARLALGCVPAPERPLPAPFVELDAARMKPCFCTRSIRANISPPISRPAPTTVRSHAGISNLGCRRIFPPKEPRPKKPAMSQAMSPDPLHEPTNRAIYHQLLQAHHYLAAGSTSGAQLRYLARSDGYRTESR